MNATFTSLYDTFLVCLIAGVTLYSSLFIHVQGSRMALGFCSQKYRQTPFLVAKFDRKKPIICIT